MTAQTCSKKSELPTFCTGLIGVSAARLRMSFLKVATNGGAKLLARTKLGKLAVGFAADAFLIKHERIGLIGAYSDPASIFGTIGFASPVDYVLVNGKITVKDGKLKNLDEQSLTRTCNTHIRKLLANAT